MGGQAELKATGPGVGVLARGQGDAQALGVGEESGGAGVQSVYSGAGWRREGSSGLRRHGSGLDTEQEEASIGAVPWLHRAEGAQGQAGP